MDSFKIAFINVLISLLYMAPGFILCKTKKAVASHLSTISAILIYACSPCMIISSFISLDYSLVNLLNMALFFVVSFVIQLVFLLLVFLFSERNSRFQNTGCSPSVRCSETAVSSGFRLLRLCFPITPKLPVIRQFTLSR